MNLVINLQPDDWRRYRDIRIRALSTDPDAFSSTAEATETFTEQEWRRRLATEDSLTFVVESEELGDAGLATVIRCRESDAEPGDYSLVSMWVAPEARRGGVGKQLVSHALHTARGFGARRVTLWVAWGNLRAEMLYQQFGFKRTGETGTFQQPRETPTFKMALKLN